MTPIALLAGLIAALGGRAAVAVEPGRCRPTVVNADATLRDQWPGLPEQIRAAFEGRGDVDRCARIELTMPEAAIVVRVTLPDGRTAARSVVRREDVLPTLEALLLLPGGGEVGADAAPGEPIPGGDEARGRVVTTAVHFEPAPSLSMVELRTQPPAEISARVRIDLALAAGARVGDGHLGVGVGLVSFVDLRRWRVGFQGQLNFYEPVGAGDAGQPGGDAARVVALELGILGGRRVPFSAGTLDLAVGPALALHGMTTMEAAHTSMTGTVIQTGSGGTLPRAVLISRFSFGRRSLLRTFLQADGEIGRTGASPMAGAPRLPAWTVGLALGFVVGAP